MWQGITWLDDSYPCRYRYITTFEALSHWFNAWFCLTGLNFTFWHLQRPFVPYSVFWNIVRSLPYSRMSWHVYWFIFLYVTCPFRENSKQPFIYPDTIKCASSLKYLSHLPLAHSPHPSSAEIFDSALVGYDLIAELILQKYWGLGDSMEHNFMIQYGCFNLQMHK